MRVEFSSDQVSKLEAGTLLHIYRTGNRWHEEAQLDFYLKEPLTKTLHKFRPSISVPSVQQLGLGDVGFYVDNHPIAGNLLELLARQGGYASAEELLTSFGRQRRPVLGQLVHLTAFRYLEPDEPAPAARTARYLARIVAVVAPTAEEAAYAYLLTLARHLASGPGCTPANVVTALLEPIGSTWHPEATTGAPEWPVESLHGLWEHPRPKKKFCLGDQLPVSLPLALVA